MFKFLGKRAVIRFGEFETDLRLRQLLRQGQRADIQEKSFTILVTLLEKPGEIVSREELRTRLWSGVSHGDTDHNLDVCVEKLRRALGDSANHPRFIKTISGSGYCFIAPVEVQEAQHPKQQSGRIRLAVLPFALQASNTPAETCNFCNELAVEINTDLAHLYADQIGVIAHSSVLKYRGTTKSQTQIGRELRADYLLEITCRTASNCSHIMAQLVQVKDQSYLWAERYHYSSGDLITIQNEVAQRVAQSLGLKLLPGRATSIQKHGTQSAEAHLLFVKGCQQQWEQTEESLRRSIEHFERAVQLDPKYAAAYSALANSYSIVGLLGFAGPPSQCFPKAMEAAREALRIIANLAGPHVSLAIVKYLHEWDWAGSDKLLRRALELNPSDTLAHRVLAYLLSSRRRPEEAIAEAWQACELDPASLSASVCLGAAYYLGRREEEAIATLKTILDVKPNFGPALMWLGACYTSKSMHAEAIAALEKAKEHRPHALIEAWLGSAYARAGRTKQAKAVLAKLTRLSTTNYVSAFGFALIYAGLEQNDQAFEWLAKACEERCPFFAVLLPVDPRLDLLRSDSRFASFADRFMAA